MLSSSTNLIGREKFMNKIIFTRFENAFEKLSVTKADFARMLSASIDTTVRPNTLQGWFERKTIPSKYLYPIAEALMVSPRYLIGETDDDTRMQIIPIIGTSTSVVPSMPIVTDGLRTIERHYFADNVYAIEADTDAMMPTIQKNSLCLCNPNAQVEDGSVVHYTYGEQSGIARYRLSADKSTVVLAHDNTDIAPIFISWDSEIELKKVKIFRIEQNL